MFDHNNGNQIRDPENAYHISKLYFADIEIMMPQNEIVSIESIYELDTASTDNKYLGMIYRQGEKLPVYCFSEDMEILDYLPEGRSQCVVIRHQQGDYALLCHDIKNMVLTDLNIQSLPLCMLTKSMPLTHLCLYNEASMTVKLGLITNADQLANYISRYGV